MTSMFFRGSSPDSKKDSLSSTWSLNFWPNTVVGCSTQHETHNTGKRLIQ